MALGTICFIHPEAGWLRIAPDVGESDLIVPAAVLATAGEVEWLVGDKVDYTLSTDAEGQRRVTTIQPQPVLCGA